MPLDQLLDSYRRGVELLGYCRDRLKAVEEQVTALGYVAKRLDGAVAAAPAGAAPSSSAIT